MSDSNLPPEMKSELLLNEVQRKQDLLLKAQGKKNGFSYKVMLVMTVVWGIAAVLELEKIRGGVLSLIIGGWALTAASDYRTNVRINALLEMIQDLQKNSKN